MVSFSLYGTKASRYWDGVAANAAGIREFYPGFSMRIHHDRTWSEHPEEMERLCDIFCSEDVLELCNVKDTKYNAPILKIKSVL